VLFLQVVPSLLGSRDLLLTNCRARRCAPQKKCSEVESNNRPSTAGSAMVTPLRSMLVFGLALTASASTCSSQCHAAGCTGCLPDDNVCRPSMSKSECYAHSSWCWCGHDSCTGSSSSLNQEQCNSWQDIFDATNGNDWYNCSDSRLDPCSCGGSNCDPHNWSDLSACVPCDNGQITGM
jgi:hypothetical protein